MLTNYSLRYRARRNNEVWMDTMLVFDRRKGYNKNNQKLIKTACRRMGRPSAFFRFPRKFFHF